jgi:membrane-associated phospholipid phosphatase
MSARMSVAAAPQSTLPSPPAAPSDGLASAKHRWTIGLLLAVVQSAIYFGIGHAPFERSTELLRTGLDDLIPFLPWTAWCYLPFYAGVFIIAIAGFRRRALFNRTARSVVLVMLVGAACHLLIRAEYPRPVLTPPLHGVSEAFMAWVQQVDAPGNVFPSLHVAHTTMLSLLLLRDRPLLGRVALTMATLLALSTLTTKQHFIADVVSGYALAFLGSWLALRGLTPAAVGVKRQVETT